MKQFPFLQVVVLAALLVAVAGCGAPMYGEGDTYNQVPARGNVYYGDPYYGGINTIVVQRDPYTGRYFQVSPGGTYGGVYNAPYYGRRYGGSGRYHENRNYNNGSNYNAGNNYHRTYPQGQQPQQTPAQRQRQRTEAKDAILGKRRN